MLNCRQMDKPKYAETIFSIAFTMAEAIIVMTILGIIATIMITNLKPAEFRDEALIVQAKKLLLEIDQATY